VAVAVVAGNGKDCKKLVVEGVQVLLIINW